MENEKLKVQIKALNSFNAQAEKLEKECSGYVHSADTITLKMSHDRETGKPQCRASGTLKLHLTVFAEL